MSPKNEHIISEILDYIIRERVIPLDQKIETMRASPTQDAEDIVNDPEQAIRVETSQAEQKREAFTLGLARVYRQSEGSAQEVPFDSRQPADDAQASALIEYLVRPGLATVRSEEVGPEQYIYYLSVVWSALQNLAKEAHLDFDPAMLAQSFESPPRSDLHI